MTRRDLTRIALVPLAAALIGAAAPVPSAADLAWLHGTWRGDGTFMGRPSSAELVAAPALEGRFLELAWTVDVKGDRPMRYRGRGLYKPGAEGWTGHWYDSTGAVRPLTAVSEPGIFRSAWGTPETEQGRSAYTLAGGTLTVEDTVLGSQGPRVFATHRLTRQP